MSINFSLYLVPNQSIWKSVKSRFEEKFLSRERNIDRIDVFFFFFLKLLYSSLLLLLSIQPRYRFHETETRNWRCHFPEHASSLTFLEGKWRDSLIRVSFGVLLGGKKGKGRWYFAFNRAIIEGKRRRNSRDGFSTASSRNYLDGRWRLAN